MNKKKFKKYLGGSLFVLVTMLLGILPMLTAGAGDELSKASTLTGIVGTADLVRSLSGGGSLTAVDEEDILVPQGVKITALLAANGDVVKKGDPIASVDKVSVMTAVTEVQKSMEATAKELKTLSAKLTPGAITVDEEGNIYSAGKKVETSKLPDYAKYLTLSMQHRDYEEILLELFQMNQTGTVNAPKDGMVDGLSKAVVSKTSFSGEAKLELLAVHIPDPEAEPEEDDGLTYLCYAGVVNAVQESGWSMLMNPTPYEIKDFLEPGVNTNLMGMTAAGVHAAGTVMEYNAETEEWGTVELIQSGDLLLFTYVDGQEAFIVKLGKAELPQNPVNPTRPTNPTIDWSKVQGILGSRGSSSQTQEEEKYAANENYLCTVIPQEKMLLPIAIDEKDIAELSVGMTASVSVDALPNTAFTGSVTNISKFGAGNGGSSKFTVEIELDYAVGMLPGMNAAASLVLETKEAVPVIPVAALVEQGTRTLVYTGYDAKNDILLNPVPVTLGLSDGINAELLSGLTEGMPFWYSYYDTLEISNAVEARGMFG